MGPSYTAAFVLFLREKFSSFSFDFVRRKKKKEDDLSAMQTKSIKVARSQSSNLLLSIDNLAIVIGDIFHQIAIVPRQRATMASFSSIRRSCSGKLDHLITLKCKKKKEREN